MISAWAWLCESPLLRGALGRSSWEMLFLSLAKIALVIIGVTFLFVHSLKQHHDNYQYIYCQYQDP